MESWPLWKEFHEFVDAGHERFAQQYRRHNQHHKHEDGEQYSACDSSTAKRSLEHLINRKNGNGDNSAPKNRREERLRYYIAPPHKSSDNCDPDSCFHRAVNEDAVGRLWTDHDMLCETRGIVFWPKLTKASVLAVAAMACGSYR